MRKSLVLGTAMVSVGLLATVGDLPATAAPTTPRYALRVLTAASGRAFSTQGSINDVGLVAALTSSATGYTGAVFDTRTRALTVLPVHPGQQAIIRSVDLRGRATGELLTDGDRRPLAWNTRTGRIRTFASPDPADPFPSTGEANDRRRVLVTADAAGTYQGYLLNTRTGRYRTLRGVSNPEAVNERNWVAGENTVARSFQPVVWRPGRGATPLRAPAGETIRSANVADVNDAGQVLGSLVLESGINRSVLWPTPDSAPCYLPEDFFAEAINDRGVVVGNYRSFGDEYSTPSVWTAGCGAGTLVELPHPPGSVVEGLNDHNRLLGRQQELVDGTSLDNYLWTPTSLT